jgi:hypothetical protein
MAFLFWLLASCFPKESFISLVRVQGNEDNTSFHQLLRQHRVACCGREFIRGGHQCWSLVFDCYMASKTRQHKLKDCNLLPPITPFPKDNFREKLGNGNKHVTTCIRKEYSKGETCNSSLCLGHYHFILINITYNYKRTFGFTQRVVQRYNYNPIFLFLLVLAITSKVLI